MEVLDVLLWLLKWVAGPIVAVMVTLTVSEPLKNWLAPLVVKIGSKKEEGIAGRWTATFYYGPDEQPYTEIIEITHLLGQYVGHIVEHAKNRDDLKRDNPIQPLRLRGTLKDNRFFTGLWFHPSRVNHHHGAFNLLISTNNYEIKGIWLGYSETNNLIESGRWEWSRAKNA